MPKHIAVIGAGISGSLFTHMLGDCTKVTLFEKARGPGGRLSSHRHGAYSFDKGAQDFSIDHKDILKLVESARDEQVLALWKPTFMRVQHNIKSWVDTSLSKIYSGLGPMNILVKWFLSKTAVYYGNKVIQLERHGKQWMLIMEDNQRFGPFDYIVMTQPTQQVIDLMPEFKEQLGDIKYSRCFMVYLGLKNIQLKDPVPDVIYSADTCARWVIQNHSKPGFSQAPSVTIQSKNITDTQVNVSYADFSRAMIDEVEGLLDMSLKIDYQHHHMWRYAKNIKKSALDYLWSPDLGIGVIGDAFVPDAKHGIESAMLSAITLAKQMDLDV